jgi:hypothetical protein
LSLISEIDGDLASVEAGVSRAAQIAVGAESGAGDAAAHMAALGFVGIAQAMDGIRMAIAGIRARIHSIGVTVAEARTPVHAAPEQPTPRQAMTVLRPLTTTLDGVHQQIGGAIAQVVEVAQRTSATLRGGQPGTLLARIDGIRTVLIAASQHTRSARERVAAALVEARAAGAGDATRDAKPFDPAPYLDDMPKHPGVRLPGQPRQKTHGRQVVPGGPAIELISGESGEDYRRAVQRAWRIGMAPHPWEFANASHIELKVATQMHDTWETTERSQHETIVLNNKPCAVYAKDCEFVIEDFLPPRSTLTVYAPDGFHKVYHGKDR